MRLSCDLLLSTGEHRESGKDGADHQRVPDPQQQVGSDLLPVQREDGSLHTGRVAWESRPASAAGVTWLCVLIVPSLPPQCSAKNCRTAFHVTCGLHASLEMNTILTDEDEVKFKSYCPKHSGLEGVESRDSGGEEEKESAPDRKGKRRGRVREEEDEERGAPAGSGEALNSHQQEKRVNLRKLKLEAMEEDFYRYVEVGHVAAHLKVSPELVDFLFQYWKLKRKANFNRPLLTPKKDEEESLARREQEVLLRRLQLFTHLRQDLERVRFSRWGE